MSELLDLAELARRRWQPLAIPGVRPVGEPDPVEPAIVISIAERDALVAALRSMWVYSGTHPLYRVDLATVMKRHGIVDTETKKAP